AAGRPGQPAVALGATRAGHRHRRALGQLDRGGPARRLRSPVGWAMTSLHHAAPVTSRAHPVADEDSIFGAGIRRERSRQGLTLAQLADRAGLTASAISQIERGVTDPSVSSLRRISSALGVPFFQFLVQSESPDPIVRRGQRRTIAVPGDALQYQLLTTSP